MTAAEVLNEIKGGNEPRVDIKLEANSRSTNWSIHVYAGVTKEEIDECVFQAMYGKNGIEKALKSGEV